ncbi:MAG: hypothetical protein MUE95_06860 [Cyclobacteriaceae bacterium]|nr:hypothetical protein [Cyclobacteriaceae bacterium]
MNHKPDEALLIAYLYGELQGDEKTAVEQYLREHPDVYQRLQEMNFVRESLQRIADKEVIAPPIVLEENRSVTFWNTGYMRMITGIAASLALLMLVARFTGLTIQAGNGTMTIGFASSFTVPDTKQKAAAALTSEEVQQMINQSMAQNNALLQVNWQDSQQQLDASIRNNLAEFSDARMRSLTKQVSNASEEQIRAFAMTLQAENARMIKDYLALNANDQRAYMEELLVDFARYLEQQHRSDLQMLQARLTNLEEENDEFRYETGQILASIINTVEPISTDIKN